MFKKNRIKKERIIEEILNDYIVMSELYRVSARTLVDDEHKEEIDDVVKHEIEKFRKLVDKLWLGLKQALFFFRYIFTFYYEGG